MKATTRELELSDDSVVYDVVTRDENGTHINSNCNCTMEEAERMAKEINKKHAMTRAEIQRAYRSRKATEGKVQRSFYIDQTNIEHLQAFLLSKQTGQGQFSIKQSEELSDVVNRALAQFFRKR